MRLDARGGAGIGSGQHRYSIGNIGQTGGCTACGGSHGRCAVPGLQRAV
jgi:hypothetical protein